MSVTLTPATICSNASLMLGGNVINDLTEETDRARLAGALWPSVRDYVLRRHPWNCAVKRVVLSPDAEPPAFDWAFQYTLPGDFMRVLSVGESGIEDSFAIESGKLLCDDSVLLLRYVWRNENPATWDDMLVWGMTVSMKAAMAYGITASASLSSVVEDELKMVLKQARAVDGQDGTPETLGDSPLLRARMSGGSSWWRR